MEIMRLSQQYAPTLKEDPADAEIASHRLLVRAGMIRKVAGGVYTFLPLGMRVLTKIENIVREEMNAIGAHEILMPALQPGELWHESGRWNDYGPELMRLEDRHGRGFCLGPTHEELVTSIVRSELRSYRQLPMTLYQIQTKFRDEIRPRFGLLRSREFVMKDAYSFHSSQESLQKTYDEMYDAYGRICERCGLDYRPVVADGGQIGGSVTCEFHALAEAGEDDLVYCPDCDYAANNEAGVCHAHPVEYAAAECKKVETPGVSSIESLAKFLGIEEAATVKAMVGKDAEGAIFALFIPGDHELNEIKAERVVNGFTLLTDEELEAAGLHKGSIGPKGLPGGIKVIGDVNLKNIERWVVGANEDGFHFVGAKHGEDFQVDEWADLSLVMPGDACPKCGAALQGARGIEVSQVFQLGDKYSKTMGAVYSDENGVDQNFLMGCYGVGISRTLAAIVEQHHDEDGIIWPMSVAPYHVIITLVKPDDQVQAEAAEEIYSALTKAGVETLLDDRKERPGVKFKDAELIGVPLIAVAGRDTVNNGTIEVRDRNGENAEAVPVADAAQMIADRVAALLK